MVKQLCQGLMSEVHNDVLQVFTPQLLWQTRSVQEYNDDILQQPA